MMKSNDIERADELSYSLQLEIRQRLSVELIFNLRVRLLADDDLAIFCFAVESYRQVYGIPLSPSVQLLLTLPVTPSFTPRN